MTLILVDSTTLVLVIITTLMLVEIIIFTLVEYRMTTLVNTVTVGCFVVSRVVMAVTVTSLA
ncbi:hypothetical protein K402DRAFT_389557 [Aulographum hederae CBS 113979]|uniref:Uncharacterized protein n=1 Tax=Aulographum hederae CBS 113979 TaxID=1176131 RepID=A0A6G1HBN8_9PEZI|nr:hypothetical protein K402DRAFT_389557 [Aulographum hederae CBS 113979]